MKKDLVTAEIIVKENKVGILRVGNINYISLSDLARYQNSSDPSFTVKNWLRTINTIDYIGLWEQIHNQDFNLVEFDQIKTEYGRKSFAMSPTQWIKRTNAIGIISKGGRYSIGTYVGIDITKYPFKVIHTKLGITKCRFYDLRGTYTTKLSNSGTPMNDVSELMGHSNPSLLKNITLQV